MLSLVLVTIVVANVFIWQFQMNQADWERMREKIEILDVISASPTWHFSGLRVRRVQHNITGRNTAIYPRRHSLA
jgi:hypothetical protein